MFSTLSFLMFINIWKGGWFGGGLILCPADLLNSFILEEFVHFLGLLRRQTWYLPVAVGLFLPS